MSYLHMSRRELLEALGIATIGVVTTSLVSSEANAAQPEQLGIKMAGDPSFMNNVPEPVLSGKELPTFKFPLEKSKGKVFGGSSVKEATVKQLPISTGIGGVSMVLEPGGMRELHWHATAAEWAFVLSGRVRTTVVDPQGRAETNDFDPGDVWYFPRGHGHMLQCLGDTPCHFILILDNGHFSEFGTFSITDWISHTPKALLAKNLGLPEAALDKFPKKETFFTRGALPPAKPAPPLQGWKLPPKTHRYRLLATQPQEIFKGGRAWVVDASRFPISKTITGVVLDLDPGALRELHWHPNADEWQYVIAGRVSVTLFGSHGGLFGSQGRYRIETLETGDVGYIPQGYGHSIENVGDTPSRVLIGFNSGTFEAIDLSQWIAGNPADVLVTNFGLPPALVGKLPKKDVFIAD